MFDLIFLLIPVVVIGISFAFSYLVERNHFHRLAVREAELVDMVVTDLKHPSDSAGITAAHLVSGQAVIGTDYFKSWISGLRNLVGGEMRALQSMLTRARREALLRMLQEARRLGADEVINVRFETSNVMSSSRRQKGAMCAEIYAYGTAIVRRPAHA